MNAVEKELLKATGAKAQAKNESRQAFLTRLGKSVNDLGEEDYEALSDEAVTWYEGAVKAAKSKKELPDFEEPEVETEVTDDPEVEKEKPNKGSNKSKKTPAKPAKKTPAKPAKKTPAKPAKKTDGVIQHREGSVREKAHRIFDELSAKGKDRAAILAAFAKLGWADATCKTQYQVFKQAA